tara:strand:- start:725 stop:976 length:252 start_codon:yes stop_codon:yes gene_type:complete
MIEIMGAVAGAIVGAAVLSVRAAGLENRKGRDTLVRLTSAVESLSAQLDMLRREQISLHAETFGRLSDVERSVARLEGTRDRN